MPAPERDTDLLEAAYGPLLALSDRLCALPAPVAEDHGWTATALPGWTVRDLLFHLATDAQRALVALHSPAPGPADTDATTYWSSWTPGTPGAQAGLRGTRAIASQWSAVTGPADLHRSTARAVLHAVGRVDPEQIVATQGHRLTVAALVSTLAVEATVHTLDLAAVCGPPAAVGLAEVRRVTEGLLGAPVPAGPDGFDDLTWALLATGRRTPTDTERADLGGHATRLPLFG